MVNGLYITQPKPSRHPTTLPLHQSRIRSRKIELFYNQLNHGERMRYIGKSKIGKQYSKPTITYPIIRLPVQCSEAIGTSVQIFKSEHAGKPYL